MDEPYFKKSCQRTLFVQLHQHVKLHMSKDRNLALIPNKMYVASEINKNIRDSRQTSLFIKNFLQICLIWITQRHKWLDTAQFLIYPLSEPTNVDSYHSNYPNEWFLLSHIRGSAVVLRDQIHKELGHTIDPNQFMIKKHSKSINSRGEQGSCSVD